MQSGTSARVSGTVKQSKKLQPGAGVQQSSRVRNSSGTAAAAAGGGKTVVLCDGRNVTPKTLVPGGSHRDTQVGGREVGIDSRADEAPYKTDRILQDEPPPPTLAAEIAKISKSPGLSHEELTRNVDIILGETETDTLLFFPSQCVALDNPFSSEVTARNKAYDELCASKADSDQFAEQHAQTLNHPHKSKEVLAAPPSQESVEVNANRWDIHDTFMTDPVPRHDQIQQACERESAAQVALAVKKPGCLFNLLDPYPNVDGVKEHSKSGKELRNKAHSGKVLPPGTLSASTSKLTSPNSGAVGNPNSGQMSTAHLVPSTAEDGDTVLSPGEGAISPRADDAPVDTMPWRVGANTPIPEELLQALRTMERIVSQNVFHKQHMIYRDYPTLEELNMLDMQRTDQLAGGGKGSFSGAMDFVGLGGDATHGTGRAGANGEEKDADAPDAGEDDLAEAAADEATRIEQDRHKPRLQDLFCFDAPQLTQRMCVTCAEWNRHNQDLLAVSYGDTAPVPSKQGGLVLFWSLKNPTYPERVIRAKHGVTVLHFSSQSPSTVAAGLHDGSVNIWDLRRPSDVPVLRSGNDQKHMDIVWETQWVDRGSDKQPQELLVSVSSDGNVLQWSMKKGLEQSLLMQLKRLPNPHLGANSVYGHKEGIVFRKSSGFCVAFPHHDPSTYLVGTEDGLVHRCSTSYNEQYLDTYYGHSGPVYRVRCNPFMSQVFLTCSADWTMKLWTTRPAHGHQPDAPLLTFQSTDLSDAVNDVVWAPNNSTSFAAAMDDGRVELWDLAMKPLDPIVVHHPRASQPQNRRTCVRFSSNSPVLVAGDDQGRVDVMRMYNTNQSYYSEQEQQDRLSAVMVKKR